MFGFRRQPPKSSADHILRIGFYQPHLDIRGTGVSLYEYARYNESLLGNRSVVFCDRTNPYTHPLALEKFKSILQVVELKGSEDMRELRSAAKDARIDALYIQKCGKKNDGRFVDGVPLLIHVVGIDCDPHGAVYAYTSRWSASVIGKGKFPFVPYPVSLPESDSSLRKSLGIPTNAKVFGRLGGPDSWNIEWVNEVIEEVLEAREDIFFLAAFTPRFTQHSRAIFLEPFTDAFFKREFINTCDAMLHARSYGETFGMAVAEFSCCGRPVITYGQSEQRAHLDILGKKAVTYDTPNDLRAILTQWGHDTGPHWNAYADLCPTKVMKKFKTVFLDCL